MRMKVWTVYCGGPEVFGTVPSQVDRQADRQTRRHQPPLEQCSLCKASCPALPFFPVHVLGFHRRGRPAAWLTRSDMRPLRADPRLPEAVGRAGRAALRAHSPRGRPSPAAVPFSRGRFLLQPLPLVIPTQRLQLTFLCCSQSSSLPSARDLSLLQRIHRHCIHPLFSPFPTLQFGFMGKQTATHSSVLAWRIPGTEEPSGLPSVGLRRV